MDTQPTPKVSIVLPTHNRAELLDKAIRSVVGQTYENWELIIVDDASTDFTPQLVREWQAKDARISCIRNPENIFSKLGVTANLNIGLNGADGKYIARLDDDDYWCDNRKLEKQVNFLENNPDYVLAGGGVIVVDPAGKELYRYFKFEHDETIKKRALLANPFSHTTVMFRREAAIAVGGYANWQYAEDWDLWLRLGVYGKLYNFQEYFMAYLFSGTNKSFELQRPQTKTVLKFIAQHRREYPGFFLAYAANFAQYLFSFLPTALRLKVHPFLAYIKRRFL